MKRNNEKLVRQAQRGSAKAFASLYQEIYKELYHFALYTLKQQQDAEDAVSETVVLGYEKITALRKSEAFQSWMFQILANQCRKKQNDRQKIQPVEELPDIQQTASADIGERLTLLQTFDVLAPEERLIVALSVFGGYNSNEMAQLLDLNPATVRSKLSRSLAKLRKIVGEGQQ